MSDLEAAIWRALREIVDPEFGCSIVDLGIVYEVRVEVGSGNVVMTVTTPGCPLHDVMVDGVAEKVRSVPGIGAVEVKVVWDPPWTPEMMSEEMKQRFESMYELE